MPENLNHKEYDDIQQSYNSVTAARRVGFRDGFAFHHHKRIYSNHAIGNAYNEGYKEGKEHRIDVNSLCEVMGLTVEEVYKQAFDFYKSGVESFVRLAKPESGHANDA